MHTSVLFNFLLDDSLTNVKQLKLIMTQNPKQSKLLVDDFTSNHNNKNLLQREYSQSFKISSGYSLSDSRSNNILKSYEDTSTNVFTFNQHTPVISFTHDIASSNIFSFSYTIGYQKSNIELNRQKFSENKIALFVNPRLTTYRNNRIETYSQLKIGLVLDDKNTSDIKSLSVRYLLSPKLKFYTGFTPIGISFNLSKTVAINFEWSIWSYESFNFGIKYNFNKRN
jgi:hypothetical protein